MSDSRASRSLVCLDIVQSFWAIFTFFLVCCLSDRSLVSSFSSSWVFCAVAFSFSIIMFIFLSSISLLIRFDGFFVSALLYLCLFFDSSAARFIRSLYILNWHWLFICVVSFGSLLKKYFVRMLYIFVSMVVQSVLFVFVKFLFESFTFSFVFVSVSLYLKPTEMATGLWSLECWRLEPVITFISMSVSPLEMSAQSSSDEECLFGSLDVYVSQFVLCSVTSRSFSILLYASILGCLDSLFDFSVLWMLKSPVITNSLSGCLLLFTNVVSMLMYSSYFSSCLLSFLSVGK